MVAQMRSTLGEQHRQAAVPLDQRYQHRCPGQRSLGRGSFDHGLPDKLRTAGGKALAQPGSIRQGGGAISSLISSVSFVRCGIDIKHHHAPGRTLQDASHDIQCGNILVNKMGMKTSCHLPS